MKNLFDNRIFKFILKVVSALYFFVVILYFVFAIAHGLSKNMSLFGYRFFTIKTSSMTGVYNLNDVVLVKDVDCDKLKVDDDIVYLGERGGLKGMLVTNRIVKIPKDKSGVKKFITKGVKSNVEDPSITGKNIIGKIVGKIPVITQINHIVENKTSFFFIIFFPLVLIIILEIVKTVIDINAESKNNLKEKNIDEPVIIATIDISKSKNSNEKMDDLENEKDSGKKCLSSDHQVKEKTEKKSELKNEHKTLKKDKDEEKKVYVEVPQIIKNEKVENTSETKKTKKDSSDDIELL